VPSHCRLAARDQFRHAERLDDEVVGARLQKPNRLLLLDTTERMMMGTFEAALIRSSTSYPLPSGNDRSRMMRSGKLDVAVRKAVVAFSASSTLKSRISKPARRKRLIFGSSSTTSTTLLVG